MNDQLSTLSPPGHTTAQDARPAAMVFVRDRDSEGVIRQSFAGLGVANVEFFTGGIDAAITTLAQRPSPRLLITDVSGVSDPASRINTLADVCEPGVGVVVIGDNNDIRLYRNLKDAGIVEYFFKPLVVNLLTQTFNTILTGNVQQRGTRTGKLVFVMGLHGGDGATTIAINTAWHLAQNGQRRVLVFDLDLQFGDAALQLDATPSHALREALEHPDRVDDLFLQRGVTHVTERLDLLAALENLGEDIPVNEDAVLALLGNLLQRYRFVFVDMPAALAPSLMRVLTLPSTLLLVSTGSLASARDVVRWRQQFGPNTPERVTLHVMNKAGALSSLSVPDFIRAVGSPPDIIIPHDREIAIASKLGIGAVQKCAPLQRGLTPLYRNLAGEGVPPRHSLLKRLLG